ncbi:hypothetical protein D3C78_1226450 [compost metagenome]
MNTCDFQRSYTQILPDSVVLVNDIIADLKLSIAFDTLGIIDLFVQSRRFALLLREHLAFRNNNQMRGWQLKTGLQIALQHNRRLDTIIFKHAAHAFHTLSIACEHHNLSACLAPALYLRLQHIHLTMEALHRATRHIQNILRLGMRNLT